MIAEFREADENLSRRVSRLKLAGVVWLMTCIFGIVEVFMPYSSAVWI